MEWQANYTQGGPWVPLSSWVTSDLAMALPKPLKLAGAGASAEHSGFYNTVGSYGIRSVKIICWFFRSGFDLSFKRSTTVDHQAHDQKTLQINVRSPSNNPF